MLDLHLNKLMISYTTNSDPNSASINLRSGSPVTQTSTAYGRALPDTKAVIGQGNLLAYLQQAKAESLQAKDEQNQVNYSNPNGSTLVDSSQSYNVRYEIGSAYAEPYAHNLDAEQFLQTGYLQLDADVKNLVITVPQHMYPSDPSVVNSDLQLEITVVQGTKLTWLNSAPTDSHRIAVYDEATNELVYASAPIRNSEADRIHLHEYREICLLRSECA